MKTISKRIRYFFVFLVLFLNITGFSCSAAFTDWLSSGQQVATEEGSDSTFQWEEMLELMGCDSVEDFL